MPRLKTRPRPLPGSGAVLLTLGGLAAAFAAASCCALPLLLAAAGVGTAWLGGIALVAEPHRALLLTVAAGALAGGAFLLWQQRHAPVCGLCTRPGARCLTLSGLLIGLVLLYLGYAIV